MSTDKTNMFMSGTSLSPPAPSYPPPPPPPPPDISLFYEFASETTAHGVGKVVKANTKLKRFAWILALVGAFLVAAVMIGLRLVTVSF